MTTTVRETMEQEVGEGMSGLITFNLIDELGNPVTLAQIGTLTWKHYNEVVEADGTLTITVINSRTAVDIKNLNGGTVHATSGACTLVLTPADNPIMDPAKRAEWHIARITCTYNGGAGVVVKEIEHKVVNLT